MPGAGVAADQEAGVRDHRREFADAGGAGQHGGAGQPCQPRHPPGQRRLLWGAGDHHVVSPSTSSWLTCANRCAGQRRRASWPRGAPPPRRRHPGGWRPGQRQLLRVGRDPVPGQQPAPAGRFRLLFDPLRTVQVVGCRAGEGVQLSGAGGEQQPVGLWPATVQVHRQRRRRSGPRFGQPGDRPVPVDASRSGGPAERASRAPPAPTAGPGRPCAVRAARAPQWPDPRSRSPATPRPRRHGVHGYDDSRSGGR